VTRSSMALAGVALGCALLVGARITAEQPPAAYLSVPAPPPGVDTAAATAPKIEDALGAVRLADLGGRPTSAVPRGQPTIVMINSRTCPWCKRSLADIGRLAGGTPLPRLTVLTLEGAAEGTPMLAKEKIIGARLIGPRDDTAQTALTFRVQGTPTFFAVDRNGRVARTLPGYPMEEELKHWLAVMRGSASLP